MRGTGDEKKEIKKKSEGILLPDSRQIREIDKDEGYKYLGVLETDGIKDIYPNERRD